MKLRGFVRGRPRRDHKPGNLRLHSKFIQRAPTLEQQIQRQIQGDDGFGETQKEALTPEPVCKLERVEDRLVKKLYTVLAFN